MSQTLAKLYIRRYANLQLSRTIQEIYIAWPVAMLSFATRKKVEIIQRSWDTKQQSHVAKYVRFYSAILLHVTRM